MLFEERINKFIGSLSSAKASDLADKVRNVVNRPAEECSPAEEAREDIPDMILAEDSGLVGGQMESDDFEFSINAYKAQAQSERSKATVSSGFNKISRPYPAGDDFIPGKTKLPEVSARNVMSKKLNYFQIERAAEIIKERLESEMKIEKERHGEEP